MQGEPGGEKDDRDGAALLEAHALGHLVHAGLVDQRLLGVAAVAHLGDDAVAHGEALHALPQCLDGAGHLPAGREGEGGEAAAVGALAAGQVAPVDGGGADLDDQPPRGRL